MKTPLILSLVYTGGTILASKRTPYDDLVNAGFNEQELVERLHRQHKLICAAIRAGRIEDLKRMNVRSTAQHTSNVSGSTQGNTVHPNTPNPLSNAQEKKTELPPTPVAVVLPPSSPAATLPTVRAATHGVADFARPAADPNSLHVNLIDEKELRAGEMIALQIHVGRGTEGKEAIHRARVTVKLLGTSFPSTSYSAITDQTGIAVVRAAIPHFSTGRAAILIRVTANGYEAELRRIIHPSA